MTETKKAATTTETKAESKAKATSEVKTAPATESTKLASKISLVKPDKIMATESTKPVSKVNLVKPAKVESEPIISEQVMNNVLNATKLRKKSAGAKIREIFAKALADGKITADVVKMLLSTDDTKKTLNIRYAFLKPVTKNPNDRKIGGHARYGTTAIQIGDKKFWVTNDLYEKQINRFETWVASLYEEKKIETKAEVKK